MAGLQTQYAPSGYVGLWSRLAGFRRADLTDAMLGPVRGPPATARREVDAEAERLTAFHVDG